MSRTARQIIQDRVAGKPPVIERRPEAAGRRSMRHQLKRDNAAAGLSDHQQERARTRWKLRADPEREDIRAGRTRKYQDKRGEYRL